MADRLTLEELAELERLSKAASFGPWRVAPDTPGQVEADTRALIAQTFGAGMNVDAAFIAAANPAAALALLAMAKRLLALESALEFMAHHEDLFDLWEDGTDGYKCCAPDERQDGPGLNTPTAALLDCARFRGWKDPTP